MSELFIQPINPKHGSGTFITNEKPFFGGGLADIQSLATDIFFGLKSHSSFNFTLIKSTTTESYNGLTGCLLSLFRNQSDIYIKPSAFPVGEHSIDYSSVFGQSSLEFITGYSSSDYSSDGDVTESLASFSVINWIMIFILLFIVFSGLRFSHKLVRKRKRNRNRNLGFKVFSHFLWKDFLVDDISKSIFQFSFILTIFSYIIIVIFNCVIKTDLVYVPKPYVPYSYQDIIDNKTAWIWFTHELEPLIKRSPLGTTDRAFYDSVEERNWKHFDKEYKNMTRNKNAVAAHIFNYLGILYGHYIEFDFAATNIFKLKVACSTKAHFKDEVMSLVENLYPTTKHLYPWASSDENNNHFLFVFAKRSAFIPDFKIKLRSQRIFEAGNQVMFEGKGESTTDRLKNVIPGLVIRFLDNERLESVFHFQGNLR